MYVLSYSERGRNSMATSVNSSDRKASRKVDIEKCIQIIQDKFGEKLSNIEIQDKQTYCIRVFILENVARSSLRPSEIGDGVLDLIARHLFDRCIKHTIMKLKFLENQQGEQIDELALKVGNLWNWRIVTALGFF